MTKVYPAWVASSIFIIMLMHKLEICCINIPVYKYMYMYLYTYCCEQECFGLMKTH